jgi:hypothetical protein
VSPSPVLGAGAAIVVASRACESSLPLLERLKIYNYLNRLFVSNRTLLPEDSQDAAEELWQCMFEQTQTLLNLLQSTDLKITSLAKVLHY